MLVRKRTWRTLFGRKGELWYFTQASPIKTADRPHPITILLGVLSPMLAIVALFISFDALKTSRSAMEIGQRAYLTPVITRLYPKPNPNFQEGGIELLEVGLTIQNVGNTPAFLLAAKHFLEKSDSNPTQENGDSLSGLGTIAPRQELVAHPASLSLLKWRDGSLDSWVYYFLVIDWEDVFRVHHSDHWCFQISIEEHGSSAKAKEEARCDWLSWRGK